MKVSGTKAPQRINDLVRLSRDGADLALSASFEIVPVDFREKDAQYMAYVFLCRYTGTVNGKEFSFRKCYAKGCPHNLCPHVAQAVMIANRYLQRDYDVLQKAGIQLEHRLFRMSDMIVKFDQAGQGTDTAGPAGEIETLHDYLNRIKPADHVGMQVELEIIPAVEHFANYLNEQTFLTAGFTVKKVAGTKEFQQCFACYETSKEQDLKHTAIALANERLEMIYSEFDAAGVPCEKAFFH